jgi:hypothetical protein
MRGLGAQSGRPYVFIGEYHPTWRNIVLYIEFVERSRRWDSKMELEKVKEGKVGPFKGQLKVPKGRRGKIPSVLSRTPNGNWKREI